jgi:prepilin-type N-terminal cleavage/methylation domain-containing protein
LETFSEFNFLPKRRSACVEKPSRAAIEPQDLTASANYHAATESRRRLKLKRTTRDRSPIVEHKQDRGFTLVELLIVIVILGILATVTVFAVTGLTKSGKETACKADKKTLVTAVESYNAKKGNYPATLAVAQTEGLISLRAPRCWPTAPTTSSTSTPPLLSARLQWRTRSGSLLAANALAWLAPDLQHAEGPADRTLGRSSTHR